MSRFADKLKNALQVTPPAMGFSRNVTPAPKPHMLVVAQLAFEDTDSILDVVKYADAIVVVCNKAVPIKTLKALLKAVGDVPLGLHFIGIPQVKATEGVDFKVFVAENRPLLSGDFADGKVLAIPLDLPDGLARTLSDLPVESVLVNATGELSWVDLMRLYFLNSVVTKPLLAQVSVAVSENEINMLWDAGVDALVVSLSSDRQADFIKLRTTVDGLKLAPKRKWVKTRAIVPVVRQDGIAHTYDDDDDSGDDE